MRTIDADALEKKINYFAFESDSSEVMWQSGCWIRYKLFKRCLDETPEAQPEQKMGRWIFDPESYPGGNPQGRYDCSRCGESTREETRYCPWCGARMTDEGKCDENELRKDL